MNPNLNLNLNDFLGAFDFLGWFDFRGAADHSRGSRIAIPCPSNLPSTLMYYVKL